MDKDQEMERLRAENQQKDERIASLEDQMEILMQRLQELEGRLKKDSHTSHVPPSSERFARHPKSLRKKSDKPSGGEQGHAGHHVMKVATADQIVVHPPEVCCASQHDLTAQPVWGRTRRQVFEVPVPRLMVSEHQAQSKCCPRCRALTQASFAEQVTAPVQSGPAIQGMAVALSQVHVLPDERVCQVLAEMVGVCISVGSLHRWILRCAEPLIRVEHAIKAALQQVGVLHQDETGLYVGGKRHWRHVWATASLTHYPWHAKRGREAMDPIGLAPLFQGISVHDGRDHYQGYPSAHALCHVHHLRELRWIEETVSQDWASQLQALLLDRKAATDQARQAGEPQVDATLRHRLLQRYETLLTQAEQTLPPDPPPKAGQRGRRKRPPARCLWDRLPTYQQQVLAFLHHLCVLFDNRQAERDIRMVKGQQKVSGCFRSPTGADAFCRIRGYISTMRKQRHALLPLLEGALAGSPGSPAF